MQLPVYLAIMMTDAISEKRPFDEQAFNKSMSRSILI
jgi:hypothetical protein